MLTKRQSDNVRMGIWELCDRAAYNPTMCVPELLTYTSVTDRQALTLAPLIRSLSMTMHYMSREELLTMHKEAGMSFEDGLTYETAKRDDVIRDILVSVFMNDASWPDDSDIF